MCNLFFPVIISRQYLQHSDWLTTRQFIKLVQKSEISTAKVEVSSSDSDHIGRL